eukprot:m.54232 g.54232  ORF g.54232 m.54232 type:complete len:423 (+) comp11079_c0_seq1:147-1415(+)
MNEDRLDVDDGKSGYEEQYLNRFSEGDITSMPFRNQGDHKAVQRGGDEQAQLSIKRRQSKRMVDIESVLQEQHVSPNDQKKVLLNVQQLESDLAMVRRNLGQKTSVMRSTKEQQKALIDKIDELEVRIKDLLDAIKKKERVITRLRSQANSFEEDVKTLKGEKAGLLLEHSRAMETQTTLSISGFLSASNVYVTPEKQQEEQQRHRLPRKRRNSKKGGKLKGPRRRSHDPSTVEADTRPVKPNPLLVLLELISKSRESVDVMCHSFVNVRFGQALAAASARGVRVRVMFDANWYEMTVKSTSVSKPKQNWETIHRRWAHTKVEFRPQHGPMHISRPTPIFAPFKHNAVIIDGDTVAIGPYQFADTEEEEESSLVVIHAQIQGKNECVGDVKDLFEMLWKKPIATLLPPETTVVKFPPLTGSS